MYNSSRQKRASYIDGACVCVGVRACGHTFNMSVCVLCVLAHVQMFTSSRHTHYIYKYIYIYTYLCIYIYYVCIIMCVC